MTPRSIHTPMVSLYENGSIKERHRMNPNRIFTTWALFLGLLHLLIFEVCAASPAVEIPADGELILDIAPEHVSVELLQSGMNRDFVLSRDAEGIELVVKKHGYEWWESPVRLETMGDIEPGDRLLLFCELKTDQLGTQDERPTAYFIFNQEAPGKSRRLLTKMPEIGTEWQSYSFPFVADVATASGKAHLLFTVGPMPQSCHVRALKVFNYRKSRSIDELPRTRLTYKGREPEAGWREEALERIEKVRKGDIRIKVTTPEGLPVSGADVELSMLKHEFAFGSAISTRYFSQRSQGAPDRERYLQTFLENFNWATFENGMKPKSWENGSASGVMRGLEFFQENGVKVHGHVLVWGWDNENRSVIPEKAYALFDDKEALQNYILDSIRTRMAATRGKIVHWDVINEQIERTRYQEILGMERTLEWFSVARASDPGAGLMLNDFDILIGKNLDAYIKMHEYYRSHGVRLDAVGVQGHFNRAPDIAVIEENLRKLSSLGLPIIITEFDLNTDDDELQGDFMRDFLILIFSHPSVSGFFQWGFWEGMHWRPDAALYRRDWSEKPNLKAYRDLVFDQWMTHERGKTDDRGEFRIRGFKGDYQVNVTVGSRVIPEAFSWQEAGEVLNITISDAE